MINLKNPHALYDDEAVHCPTERDAKVMLQILKDNGFYWLNGGTIKPDEFDWVTLGEKTCFIFKFNYGGSDPKRVGVIGIDSFRYRNTLYQVSDFID